MTFSSNNLNDIANLYESIGNSGQEQLNEGAADAGVGARNIVGGAANFVKNQTVKGLKAAADVTGAQYQGYAGQKTTSKDPIARASNAVTRAVSAPVRDAGNFVKGLVTGQGDKAAPSKYKSSSDGKMYANYNDALAARNSRAKTATASPADSSRPAGSSPAGGAPGSSKVLPTKPAGPAKPTGSAMDQWAKANPKLAAAKAERDRTRGTSATTNPLMKDMKSNLPAPAPKAASTSTLSQAAAAASKPSSFSPAPATTSQATNAARSTSPAASGSVVSATNKIAATKTPTPVAPTRMPLAQSFEYDAYDLVLEYLFDNGHVETVDEAHYVMMELDAEVIQDIVEEVLDEDANYDRNRKRAAQRAAARNAARDAGKTGAVPGVGYVTPRRESETYRDSTGTERHKSGAKMPGKDK